MKTHLRTHGYLASTKPMCHLSMAALGWLAIAALSAGQAVAADHNSATAPDVRDGIKPPSIMGADTDEGVGSLPLVVDPAANTGDKLGTLDDDVVGLRTLQAPFIRIIGSWEDFDSVVLESSGLGFIYVTTAGSLLTPSSGTPTPTPGAEPEPAHDERQLEFRFYGSIDVEFDLVELELRGIEPELSTSGEFSGATSTVCWGDLCSPLSVLPSENELFSVSQLVDSGVLLTDSVQFVAVNAAMSSVTVDLSLTSAGTLMISQGVQSGSSN